MQKSMSFSKIITVVLIVFTSIILSLQNVSGQVNLDSLWKVWNDPAKHDTIRLEAIHKIARDGYLFSQPDSGYYYAQLEYDFAKSKGLKKQVDYVNAIDYYSRSLSLYEELGNKQGIATSLNNIGNIYRL